MYTEGHGFSRAEKAAQKRGALAPEVSLSFSLGRLILGCRKATTEEARLAQFLSRCAALALLVVVAACMALPGAAGGRILFHSDRSGTEEIFVMDADGSNVRQLTHVGRREVASIDAEGSPDRERIAFSSNRTGP